MDRIDPWHARARYAAVLTAIIVLGLTARWPGLLPWPAAKWSGSILWAAMVYLLVCLAAPRAALNTRLVAALAIAVLVEFSRLYSAPWLDDFRRSTLGALTLGRIFSPWNLLAYAIGIAAMRIIDGRWMQRARSRP